MNRDRPGGGSGATLGDLLRRQGVAVGAGTPVAPTGPEGPPAGVDRLDVGGAQKVVLRRERKGRGGKTATVIEGIKLPPSGLDGIARALKRALGCGATVEGNAIVVQGDLAVRIEGWLRTRGVAKVVVGS